MRRLGGIRWGLRRTRCAGGCHLHSGPNFGETLQEFPDSFSATSQLSLPEHELCFDAHPGQLLRSMGKRESPRSFTM
jgi:hypothetical protein